jgi:tetrahydromethanopterin S-methyltransferase subunit F
MLQNEEVRAVGIEVNHDPDEDGYEEYVEDRDVIRWRTQ